MPQDNAAANDYPFGSPVYSAAAALFLVAFWLVDVIAARYAISSVDAFLWNGWALILTALVATLLLIVYTVNNALFPAEKRGVDIAALG